MGDMPHIYWYGMTICSWHVIAATLNNQF